MHRSLVHKGFKMPRSMTFGDRWPSFGISPWTWLWDEGGWLVRVDPWPVAFNQWHGGSIAFRCQDCTACGWFSPSFPERRLRCEDVAGLVSQTCTMYSGLWKLKNLGEPTIHWTRDNATIYQHVFSCVRCGGSIWQMASWDKGIWMQCLSLWCGSKG